MCKIGKILKIAGSVASLVTGNPVFSQIGGSIGGMSDESAAKKKAKSQEAAAASALASQQATAAEQEETKRKARKPVDTILSQGAGAGTGGSLGS